ncbi:MAG TPA: DUF2177 family protein [Rhizobiaceae bacterium]|nr:DUF2177 family protein [Rhizobiaceae bacterium]
MKYLIAYVIALVLFLAIDLTWLGLVARSFYVSRMGELMAEQPRWAVAFIFYALYVGGLLYFAVAGALETGAWKAAALNGALFGFFCYLTYDATNLAVMKGYDPVLAVVDTIWGAVLTGTVAGLTVLIAAKFLPTG